MESYLYTRLVSEANKQIYMKFSIRVYNKVYLCFLSTHTLDEDQIRLSLFFSKRKTLVDGTTDLIN